ncbi:MAG: DinB family protein [Anaerolineales bacterium]
MNEIQEYRQGLLETLLETARAFTQDCRQGDAFVPIESGGWNAHQIAAHVRDVQRHVYGMRIRRTAAEEDPLFNNFDADAWMAEHYRADEPLELILAEIESDVEELVAWLRTLPETAWSRVSRHETQGRNLTLQHWVERSLAHLKEHLETLRRRS